uniref:Hypotethical protein n=1 Tax=Rhizobium rhizogenes TaxID=359 RepID=Q9R720_RHIRH|nr:hypothetical protein [Rhizobium rhizogenes]AEY82385.1 hypothetical protein [Rhizobium rhizogenes]CAB65898.1 hypotethical protein [Rhizobium rhizogenes]
MLTAHAIPVTPLAAVMLTAVCRRANMFFCHPRLKKVRYRCSATFPMVMLNESYNKKHKVRYKPPALSPLRPHCPARSSCSSPRRQSIWNT